MMLPLLAFVFGTALVAAAAYALLPSRAVAIDRRLEELTMGREPEEEKPRFQAIRRRAEAARREGAEVAEGARVSCGCAWCRPATAAKRR